MNNKPEELENDTYLEITYINEKIEKVYVSEYFIEDDCLVYNVDTYDFENDVIVLKTTIPMKHIFKIKELS